MCPARCVFLCNSVCSYPARLSEEPPFPKPSLCSSPSPLRRSLTGATTFLWMARRWRARWRWWWISLTATSALSWSSACGSLASRSRLRCRTRSWARSKGGGCPPPQRVRGKAGPGALWISSVLPHKACEKYALILPTSRALLVPV